MPRTEPGTFMHGAVIVIATAGFGAAALYAATPTYAPLRHACDPDRIVFLSAVEPRPITPAVHWSWPVTERLERVAALEEPVAEAKSASDAIEAVAPRHHRRRHMRNHR